MRCLVKHWENIISALKAAEYFRMEDIPLLISLLEDAEKAKDILQSAGIKVLKTNEVLIQKLRQNVPGQLGTFCRRLADAGINILVQYSDHANQLIVVVDDIEKDGNGVGAMDERVVVR